MFGACSQKVKGLEAAANGPITPSALPTTSVATTQAAERDARPFSGPNHPPCRDERARSPLARFSTTWPGESATLSSLRSGRGSREGAELKRLRSARMPPPFRRVLLICHVSAAACAVDAARRVWAVDRELAIDLFCYGTAGSNFAPPSGVHLLELPVSDHTPLRVGIGLLFSLRRRRYDVVALSQPHLGLSRARGLLLAFAYVVGGRRAVILDPGRMKVRRQITMAFASVDFARWLILRCISRAIATMATYILERVPTRPLSELKGNVGSVVYLRTDVELRLEPLRVGGSLAHTVGILSALIDGGYPVELWTTGEIDGAPSSVPYFRLKVLLKGNLPTELAELLTGIVQGVMPPRDARPSGFVYQRYSLNNLAGLILARRWRVPLVLEANSSEAKWRQDFSVLHYPRLAYACEGLILGSASAVAAVSRNAAEDLRCSGAPANRLRVVPNGVTVKCFAEARAEPLPSGFDGFVICFVGLFYPWHGVRYLAESFTIFHERRPDARLVLVGDGTESASVRSILAATPAIDATLFSGIVSRSKATRYMAAADVLVSPHANVHRFIGSPIKIFEYMAAGKPIVATRVAQLEELLVDGTSALLVPPEDPQALAVAFERLYDDPGLGVMLGQAAQAEAIARHSWQARLKETLRPEPTC